MTTEAVVDAGDATFSQAVIDRSYEVPVIVDFWAPWCGPCRVLGPALEQLAEEYAGRAQLVKVNVDESPGVASQYGIQGIPAVKAFRAGEVVNEFVGALSEPRVRAFFETLVLSEAGKVAAEAARARAAGDLATALMHFEEALKQDPGHQAAAVGLAELLLADGQVDRAEELASRFPADSLAKRVLALLGFQRAAAGEDRAALEARLEANADDAAGHYALGNLLAVAGEWEAALEHLLATVRLDRAVADDGGRLRMLDAFNLLGDSHELTQEYRRRLTNVIF